MTKKRITIALCILLTALIPAWAVFKEKNLNQTLTVLLMELRETYKGIVEFNGSAEKRIKEQHQRLSDLIDECNELSVILYSQASENTFDLTFALNEVTKQYEQFKSEQTPYAEIKDNLSTEMERYNRLLLTLRKMPPERTAEEIEQEQDVAVALDSATVTLGLSDTVIVDTPMFAREAFELKMDDETIVVRDSCLFIAEQIVAYYWMQLQQIEKDSDYYNQTDELLRGAYDYAQNRYKTVQQKLFVEGQGNYFKTLQRFPRRFQRARIDIKSRYSLKLNEYMANNSVISSWRGPVIFIYSFQLMAILLFAILLATLLVNGGLRRTRLWGNEWFMEHKGMIIALSGVVFFLIFLLMTTRLASNTFIIRSSKVMAEFAWLIAAIFASMLIRLDRSKNQSTLKAYLPTLIVAFMVIYFRIIFIPNSVINLVFPALILLFTVWQFWVNFKQLKKVDRRDRVLLWSGAAAMAISTLMAWAGMIMGALLFLIWWMFQLALLEAVIAIAELLDRYNEHNIKERKAAYRNKHSNLPSSAADGAFIEITWLHDFIKMTLLPLLGTWSFPAAVYMACNVFNFTSVAREIFFQPIVHAGKDGGFTMSLFSLVLILSLFFVFRYIVYASKAFYRVWKTRAAVRKLDENVAFKETDINFNLANNIITLVVWGLYVIVIFLMLKIPASGLALVSTGLATGIGFAMKDVLNNFFYGIQLMSGRVRVGDIVECDGIRGTVVSLSYQSTQIEAIDGSVIIFTNTALFNKNFKNLTRNNSYQLVSFTVGVAYGTDVEKARQVILEALEPHMVRDKYGRNIVDKKRGVTVRLQNFGDSSVDLMVLMHVVVDSYATFAGKAKEVIYNAFNENGIEIPFPQQDVYIKETPKG